MEAEDSGSEVGYTENTEHDERVDGALAIKACLDSLLIDANNYALGDLARFIALAALAADEAATRLGAAHGSARLRYGKPAGRC